MGKITVVLHASLRKYAPFPKYEREIGTPIAAKEIVEELKIPDDEVGLIAIDDERSRPDSLVREGQTLKIFPPIGGG